MKLLLHEGSISRSEQSHIPLATINALQSAGIAARTRVRTRDLRHTSPRLALAEQYHDLHIRLLELFGPQAGVECD